MTWTVEAPGGRVSLTVQLTDGSPRYAVALAGATLLEGDLGVVVDRADLSSDLHAVDAEVRSITSRFTLPHGKARSGTAEASELRVTLASHAGESIVVIARAYDDGVAFRYVLPGGGSRTLEAEATTVEFGADGRAWIQPTDPPGYTAPAYEALHAVGVPIGHRADVASWNLPALFETAGTFVLVTESDTDETSFGGHIDAIEGRPAYRWVAPQSGEGGGIGERLPSHEGPWTLPWRVLGVGDLATIAECDLVRLLARSGQPGADWIVPGRVSWSWWSDHDSPKNPAALREFIDLASELGWEYTLVDANWNLNAESDIRELLDYAAAHGVGVFLWYNSGGPNNEVTEQPRDKMFDADVRRAEFSQLADWGVAGVKVDFWHSDKAESNARYLALAADAYDAGLMVNFHGCTIPRGWEVRYPNIMTMEAVRGAEQYTFDEAFPAAAPTLNTILPFTRNVVGSMDYTPVTFGDAEHPHQTTNAHELALAVVFESALGHFADSPAGYRAQPLEVCDFLRRVPVAWDETRLLSGYPGHHAVFARRDREEWWIGGINGTDADLTLQLDLEFVGGGACLLFGDEAPRRISIREASLAEFRSVTMAPRGGFAIAPVPTR